MKRIAVFDPVTGEIGRVVTIRAAPDRVEALAAAQAGPGEASVEAPDDADGEVADDTHRAVRRGQGWALQRTHRIDRSKPGRVRTPV